MEDRTVPRSCSILEINLPKILTRRLQEGQVPYWLGQILQIISPKSFALMKGLSREIELVKWAKCSIVG